MKNILVTGGAGFIGSNFIPWLLAKNPTIKVINVDKLTYAGDLKNLSDIKDHDRYKFYQVDICDRPSIEKIFQDHSIDSVFHFAAESHVDNSISGPDAFVKTNIEGTFVLIDVARKAWLEKPFVIKAGCEKNRFHHISTDEVYGTLGDTGLFTETTPYAPNSPYSASKASSDLLVRSYFHTYGMNTVTTNCSNNYGPKQHDEKLIPTIIRNAINGKDIPIYGDGKNIRDWLYVMDHCAGILCAFENGRAGETYNIGGRNEHQNIWIAQKICELLDKKRPLPDSKTYLTQIKYVQDRPGHDRRYAVDASKIENELGWKHQNTFEYHLEQTLEWYMKKYL